MINDLLGLHVRQENRNLDLECLRYDQEDEKTLQDRKELGPGYEERKREPKGGMPDSALARPGFFTGSA